MIPNTYIWNFRPNWFCMDESREPRAVIFWFINICTFSETKFIGIHLSTVDYFVSVLSMIYQFFHWSIRYGSPNQAFDLIVHEKLRKWIRSEKLIIFSFNYSKFIVDQFNHKWKCTIFDVISIVNSKEENEKHILMTRSIKSWKNKFNIWDKSWNDLLEFNFVVYNKSVWKAKWLGKNCRRVWVFKYKKSIYCGNWNRFFYVHESSICEKIKLNICCRIFSVHVTHCFEFFQHCQNVVKIVHLNFKGFLWK